MTGLLQMAIRRPTLFLLGVVIAGTAFLLLAVYIVAQAFPTPEPGPLEAVMTSLGSLLTLAILLATARLRQLADDDTRP